ncbi:QRFP-like peptide receptor [Nematostella vectensis]|nr:QRFP-like peptide receptor [Nematostella vectensis]
MDSTVDNFTQGGNLSAGRAYVLTPLDTGTKITLTTITCTIGVLAAISNAIIIYFTVTALRRPRVLAFNRSHTAYFVMSLACSDLCASGMTIPVYNAAELWIDFVNTDFMCTVVRVLNIAFPIITINNLIVISVERYLCMFHPFYIPSRRVVKGLIVGAWVAGLGTTLVLTGTYKLIPKAVGENHFYLKCLYDTTDPTAKAQVIAFVLLQFLLPFIGLAIVNIRITKFLNKRNRVSPEETGSNLKSDDWRLKNSRMFVTIVATFIVPYFPWFVYTAVNANITIAAYEELVFRHCFSIIAFANCLVNPIIYFLFSKEFRNRLSRALKFIG